ncbi:hypothetical protein A0H81_12168 [Grifola frondosa]|uniref:Uncharacterized protein n=1 Tax=Grifola frondosa TaxID=5627 RepID=A0A1C7LYM5_GRIFR|nr:hypothetical protein A0H81_12168 [Grifola frondosa]
MEIVLSHSIELGSNVACSSLPPDIPSACTPHVPHSHTRSRRPYTPLRTKEHSAWRSEDKSDHAALARNSSRRAVNSAIVLPTTSPVALDDDPFTPSPSHEVPSISLPVSSSLTAETNLDGNVSMIDAEGAHKGSTPAPSAIAPVKSSPDSPRKQSIDAEKSTEKPLPGTPSSVPLSQHRSQVSTPKPFAVTPKPADISSPIEAAPVVCIEITRKVVIGWASRWTRWGSRRCSARAGSRPTARCRDRRRRASRPPHNALPREPLCRIIAI